jgi:hypothetical protein
MGTINWDYDSSVHQRCDVAVGFGITNAVVDLLCDFVCDLGCIDAKFCVYKTDVVPAPYSAAAPPTISLISRVIAAWRAWLY